MSQYVICVKNRSRLPHPGRSVPVPAEQATSPGNVAILPHLWSGKVVRFRGKCGKLPHLGLASTKPWKMWQYCHIWVAISRMQSRTRSRRPENVAILPHSDCMATVTRLGRLQDARKCGKLPHSGVISKAGKTDTHRKMWQIATFRLPCAGGKLVPESAKMWQIATFASGLPASLEKCGNIATFWQSRLYRSVKCGKLPHSDTGDSLKNPLKCGNIATFASGLPASLEKCGKLPHSDTGGSLKNPLKCGNIATFASGLPASLEKCGKLPHSDTGGSLKNPLKCGNIATFWQPLHDCEIRSCKMWQIATFERRQDCPGTTAESSKCGNIATFWRPLHRRRPMPPQRLRKMWQYCHIWAEACLHWSQTSPRGSENVAILPHSGRLGKAFKKCGKLPHLRLASLNPWKMWQYCHILAALSRPAAGSACKALENVAILPHSGCGEPATWPDTLQSLENVAILPHSTPSCLFQSSRESQFHFQAQMFQSSREFEFHFCLFQSSRGSQFHFQAQMFQSSREFEFHFCLFQSSRGSQFHFQAQMFQSSREFEFHFCLFQSSRGSQFHFQAQMFQSSREFEFHFCLFQSSREFEFHFGGVPKFQMGSACLGSRSHEQGRAKDDPRGNQASQGAEKEIEAHIRRKLEDLKK